MTITLLQKLAHFLVKPIKNMKKRNKELSGIKEASCVEKLSSSVIGYLLPLTGNRQ